MDLNELAKPTLQFAPTVSAQEAARALSERKADVAAVVEDRRVIGIVTEKALLERMAPSAASSPGLPNLPDLLVRDVMDSGTVQTMPASAPVLDAARLMRAERVRYLALTDADGAFVALVSLRQVLSEVMDELDLKVDNLERELMADGPGG